MNLLEWTFPVYEPGVAAVLEANELPFRIPSNDYQGSYNCWGFVAFNYGWTPDLNTARWLSGREMNEYLSQHTTPIPESEAVAGDIAVFRGHDGLVHTALLTCDPEVLCHKPGACRLTIDSMENVKNIYPECYITYARVVR